MNNFVKKINIYIVVLVLLAIATHLEWFHIGSNLFFNDWKFRNDLAVSEIRNFNWSTWISFYNLGSQNIQIYTFVPAFIWGLIGDYDVATKITFFWPIAILAVIAPYFLFFHITKSKILSFLGSLTYGFSSYLIMRSTAHLPIAFVNALFPLLLLYFDKLLKETLWSRVVVFSILFSIGCYYEIRIMYLSFLILFIFFVFNFDKKFLKDINKFIFLFFATILLNLFWLLPTVLSDKSKMVETVNRGLFGSNFFTLINSLSFFDARWGGGEVIQEFIVQPVRWYFWILPTIAFLSFFQFKKESSVNKRYISFFSIVLIIGIFFSKQISEPFVSVFNFIYNNFPGLSLFRVGGHYYLFLAIGYSGLFVFGFKYLLLRLKSRNGKLIATAFMMTILLINTSSMLSKKIGATFVSRTEPGDYSLFNEMVNSDKDYFRTLWVPISSQWGGYSLLHPKISFWDLMTSDRNIYKKNDISEISKIEPSLNNFKNPNLYSNIFTSSYGQYILNMMNVKYIVVPLALNESIERIFPYAGNRQDYIDEFDEINYLKKNEVGDLVIYENKKYNPYIFSQDSLYYLHNNQNFESKFDFINKEFHQDLTFVLSSGMNSIDTKPLIVLGELFDGVKEDNIKTDGIIEGETSSRVGNNESSFYVNKSMTSVYYKVEGDRIKFYTTQDGLMDLDEKNIYGNSKQEKIIREAELDSKRKYYIKIFSDVMPVELNGLHYLSTTKGGETISLYSIGSNQISNPSFEFGLWRQVVGDCNNYDENGLVSMHLSESDKTNGSKSLQLEATRHVACTHTEIAVDEGVDYIFAFDYQSSNSKKAGYYIGFDDEKKTVVRSGVEIRDKNWNTYSKKITVPSGATSAKLYIYAYESGSDINNVVRYDNFQFGKFVPSTEFQIPNDVDEYVKIALDSVSEVYKFQYKDDKYGYENIINNPSFESGTWTSRVGDCHNYDKNSLLNMQLDKINKTDGVQSMQLEATRHDACTNIKIPVNGDSTYLLSFDYQSDESNLAGYYVGFDDGDKTSFGDNLNIDKKGWNKFEKKIVVPESADNLVLYVYAYESDGSENNIVRYDNFKLIEIPNLSNRFYFVSKPREELKEPSVIKFEFINSTKKLVHVKGATTPFFLAMSEGYHPQWQAQMNDQLVKGYLNSWWPFTNPHRVSDEYHYKLDNFLNGWYVDTPNLCRDNSACKQNDDGSYDMEMVIEFWPQRWFYFGLIISGLTLFSSFGYLIYNFLKTKWQKN